MITFIRLFLAVFFILFAVFSPINANPVQETYTNVHLISDYDTLRPGDEFFLGIRLDPKEGWHTYWKNPGDSGLAPAVKWDVFPEFSIGKARYETPSLLPFGGLMNYGYPADSILLFPVKVSPDIVPNKLYPITARVEWLVCEKICVPESANLTFSLYVVDQNKKKESKYLSLIRTSQENHPKSYKGLAKLSFNDNILSLELDHKMFLDPLEKAIFLPENPNLINHAKRQKLTVIDQTLFIEMNRGFDQPQNEERGVLKLWFRNGEQKALDVVLDNNIIPMKDPQTMSLIWVVFFAFLGGLILNIMPCVFPILSLKVLSLVSDETANKKQSALWYSLGVILTFIGLAILLEIIKVAGYSVGWGFQLQSPLFIFFLITIFFLVTLNLLDRFTLPKFLLSLPGLTDKKRTDKKRTDKKLTNKNIAYSEQQPMGQLLTGVFAVIVATPCTAPFMAVALGYALSQHFLISLLIFTSLGVGMALPYVLIVFIPFFRRILPNPGKWMSTFKKIVALPMLASMIWLLWVLQFQLSTEKVALVIFSLVALLGFIFCKEGFLKFSHNLIKNLFLFICFIIYLSPLFFIPSADQEMQKASFTTRQITTLLDQGQAVLVDVTAAWCITCQVNERTVLETQEMTTFFDKENITLLKVDWTNNDPAITRYIQSFNRNGVPLYIFYPLGKSPELLPEVFTIKQLMNILLEKKK